ncbi:hypothetical protein LP123_02355 [Moraxella bovis]|uniref:Peptidase M10 metallopeptidase domain-containing protein n=3 Tax=Moraxella bovis TaxID=476 RepID=A0AAX3ETC8_MORBO|nr:hypothetical protein [Moraxella bovis]OOR87843.1 hypothetical protein B0182_11430 [Moraxella bovis]UYZ81618.1 hypothetical protein LP113_02385 [Moraxella bovis]UYZ89102.1 hypothetical protein LP114_11910 [Moraxella bovis]UYZ95807.1 hypothetical protein LP121_04405 [Moraxella bovis]UZA03627.1 hypothetical protein LP092_02340 [Moraxella bovis]
MTNSDKEKMIILISTITDDRQKAEQLFNELYLAYLERYEKLKDFPECKQYCPISVTIQYENRDIDLHGKIDERNILQNYPENRHSIDIFLLLTIGINKDTMVFMGKNRTILHELGHSYGLYHTFIQNELSINSPHTFFEGIPITSWIISLFNCPKTSLINSVQIQQPKSQIITTQESTQCSHYLNGNGTSSKTTKASKEVNYMFKSLILLLVILLSIQNAYALTEESLCKLSSYIKMLKYK